MQRAHSGHHVVSTISGILTEDRRATKIAVGTETRGNCIDVRYVSHHGDTVDVIQTEHNREKAAAVFIGVARGACVRIWIAGQLNPIAPNFRRREHADSRLSTETADGRPSPLNH
jgi:hypothetical protein